MLSSIEIKHWFRKSAFIGCLMTEHVVNAKKISRDKVLEN